MDLEWIHPIKGRLANGEETTVVIINRCSAEGAIAIQRAAEKQACGYCLLSDDELLEGFINTHLAKRVE